MVSFKLNEKELITFYGFIIILWAIFILYIGLSQNWIVLILTIIMIYVLANLILENSYREIIPSLICVILLVIIFRIDKLLLDSIFVDVLISITSKSISFILKNGPIILLILILIFLLLFRSFYNTSQSNKAIIFFYMASLIVITSIACFDKISNYDLMIIELNTFEFRNPFGICRISIVGSCSGIYGILIFLTSFLIFSKITRIKYKLDNTRMMFFGSLGLIGVYFINLIRIMILIFCNLIISNESMQEVHLYLGGILIIGYISIFWSLIWSELSSHRKS